MKKSYSRINVYERTKLLMGCDDTFWINNDKETPITNSSQTVNFEKF